MVYSRSILLLLLWALIPPASAGGEPAGPGDRLGELLGGVSTMRAAFTQTVVDNRGGIMERSNGRMALQRPWKLRWQILEPYRYLLVSDGETLWRWDADLEQLQEEPLEGQLLQSPAAIIGGDVRQLTSAYKVKRQEDHGLEVFVLRPLEAGSFSKLEIRFRDGVLSGLALLDSLGQHTEMQFSEIEQGVELGSETFRAPVPSG